MPKMMKTLNEFFIHNDNNYQIAHKQIKSGREVNAGDISQWLTST